MVRLMSLDEMNVVPDEFALLRQRVERLEQEVAELRSARSARTHLAHDPIVAARENPVMEAVPAHPSHEESVARVGHRSPLPPPVAEPSSSFNLPPVVFSTPPPQISLENRLGSQIFNRIAIIALLIGTAYGLKLAVDNGLLGPAARVLIGLGAGIGLVLWSERFRRQGVAAFSYSLKAVGSGVLYLSIWAAFQLFNLLPDWAALLAMILVTAWNAFMAWSQDAELLAAYALIGGFLTPVLLSSGGNHEIFVFTYVLAIDAATVALIRLKRWPRLLLGTLPATVSYFIGWFALWYEPYELGVTATFLLLFWAVFVVASLGAAHDEEHVSPLQSVALPLGAAAFLATGMYFVLGVAGHRDWLPWLMLVLTTAYLGLMRLPQRRTVAAVHLSLAVLFLTIAIPLKASGRWITVAWLVEGTALFWASTNLGGSEKSHDARHETAVLRWLSTGALALGFVAVFASDYWFSSWKSGAFFQQDVGTALVGIVAFAGVAWLAFRQRWTGSQRDLLAALIAVDLLALLLCVREIVAGHSGAEMKAFVHPDFGSTMAGLTVLGGVAWVALRLSRRHTEHEVWPQMAGASVVAFNLVAVLTGVREITLLLRDGVTNPGGRLQEALAISGFLMLYSAMLLTLGFWRRAAFVRWQGLVLLVLTIAKTFLFDIGNLSQGYRVVSLLGLGALLMGVSYAYQKDWLGLKHTAAAGEELP